MFLYKIEQYEVPCENCGGMIPPYTKRLVFKLDYKSYRLCNKCRKELENEYKTKTGISKSYY